MKSTTKSVLINAAIALLSVTLVGVVGRLLTDTNSAWFTGLQKPSQFPPSILFPIFWSVIYLCFAVLVFLLLQRKQMDLFTLVTLILTGVFQWLWSLVYFRLRSLIFGLAILVVLAALAVALLTTLSEKDKRYLSLMAIYPMWLTFATFLNLALWTIN